MKKIYFIVLDGAADRKIKSLNNRTPLEVANTRYLDYLSQNGMMSLIQILPQDLVPETDSGLMALLGYDPLKYYCGRGTLETIGCGDYNNYKYFVGFRVNFASFNYEKGILDRRTARDLSDYELQYLTQEINENVKLEFSSDVKFQLISYGIHRGILAFYSDIIELSGNVSNTDPGFEKKGYFSLPVSKYENRIRECVPLEKKKAAFVTAKLVNEFIEKSNRILKSSMINKKRKQEGKCISNCLLVRDGGSSIKDMPQFIDIYKKNLSIFGELPCEKALAQLIGAEFFYSKELELQLDKKYLSKLARKLIQNNSHIVFCHLKGPDEPGHNYNPEAKIKSIELIDKYFISEIVKTLSIDDIVVVTCDHATPCELGVHSNDKVPLLISGKYFNTDRFQHMDEVCAVKGTCPVKKAVDIMKYIIDKGEFNYED